MTRGGLTALTLLILMVGLALVLHASDQEALALQGSPEGCVFDQSCDTTPAVVAARRLLRVGCFVLGAGAVLAGLARFPTVARCRRHVVVALVGLALLIVGVSVRALMLGRSVAPPTFGCQATRTCAADPWWTPGLPAYDVVLLLPVIGSVVIAIALIGLLRVGRLSRPRG